MTKIKDNCCLPIKIIRDISAAGEEKIGKTVMYLY